MRSVDVHQGLSESRAHAVLLAPRHSNANIGSMHLCWRPLVALALLGCAAEADGNGTVAEDGTVAEGDGTGSCIDGNPPGDPFDVGDVVVPDRAPGSTGPALEPPTAATIASECVASGGTGCEASRFISKEAASCLAELNDFEAGLERWSVALVYHHGHNRVVWNVMNVTNDEGAEGYSGGSLTLDATDGAVLGRGAYTATP